MPKNPARSVKPASKNVVNSPATESVASAVLVAPLLVQVRDGVG
jgi:hypothetical protein